MAIHELSKHLRVRKLTPNQIGIMTMYATILADAVTAIEIEIDSLLAQEQTEDVVNQMAALQEEAKEFRLYIRFFRLVQGWEIDRPKHGGAYEAYVQEIMNIIQNPPARVSEFDVELQKYVWKRPMWLASRKGGNGVQTGSMLCEVFNELKAWEDELLASVTVLDKTNPENNLIDELRTAVPMDPDRYDALYNEVRIIKAVYNKQMFAINERAKAKMDLVPQYYAEIDHERIYEHIEKNRATDQSILVEAIQAKLEALEDGYDAAEIGLLCYLLQYQEDGENSNKQSTSFPWTAGKLHLEAALACVSGSRKISLVKRSTFKEPKRIIFECTEVERNYENAAIIMMKDKACEVKLTQKPNQDMPALTVCLRGKELGPVWKDFVTYFQGGVSFNAEVVSAKVKQGPQRKYMELYISSREIVE
jgi:hypothetical protein